MKKKTLIILITIAAMTLTACGTISPPVQTQPEVAVTEAIEPTEEHTVPTETIDNSEEEQIKSNAFIAEFFDSGILFADVQDLVTESMKNCTFENQTESSNGIQKITLKTANGGGIVNAMCIDMSQSNLSYGFEYILENFGNYYFGLTASQMNGITEDDFVSNYRMVSSVMSKGKYQRYSSVQKTDGMAAQFGYTETYAVLAEGKLTVVSGAFLSSDMMDRQNFMQLMARFAENVKY
ncbi:MAG: hypothetical protein NC093_07030 [Alistipes sp.]|nr:hypothetical protein [Alistipes sp.]